MAPVVTHKRGPVRADSRNVVRGRETRRRILDAARALILADGFESLRLEDVARDAGVTKGAVIKSAGGKSAILLALAEEDRQSRLEVIRQAMGVRTSLRRRLSGTVRRLFRLDAPRLNLVVAFIGYVWFWTGEERDRAQAMEDDTREHLAELIADASETRLSPERLRLLSTRLLLGYAIGLRNLHRGTAKEEECVRFVVDQTID